MTRGSRLGSHWLFARHLAAARGSAALLALVAAISATLLATAPGALMAVSDAEVGASLAALPAERTELTMTGILGPSFDDDPELRLVEIEEAMSAFTSELRDPLGSVLSDSRWFAISEEYPVTPDPETTHFLRLRYVIDTRRDSHVALTDGRDPAAWEGTGTPLEVALTEDVASTLDLGVGDEVDVFGDTVVVVGLYRVLDEDDPFWHNTPELETGRSSRLLTGSTLSSAAVFVAPESIGGFADQFSLSEVRGWASFSDPGLHADDLEEIRRQVQQSASIGLFTPNGQQYSVQSRLGSAVEQTAERVATLAALLALVASAPLGTLGATLVLAASSYARSRRPQRALAAARGESAPRLRGTAALEGLVLALPGGLVAASVVSLLNNSIESTLAACVPVVVLLAAIVVLTAVTAGSPRERRNRGLVRVVSEVGVVLLAIASVALLLSRGIDTGAADPLLVATPLLVSVATCLAVLRLYPLPLRILLARMRRARGPLGLLGAAREVRSPAHGLSAVLAIVIAVSAATTSLVLGATIDSGVATAARESVGADLRAVASPSELEALAADPAIAASTLLELVPNQTLKRGGRPLSVVLVLADTAALHVTRPDVPDLSQESGIPVVFSSSIGGESTRSLTLADVAVSRGGTVRDSAIPGAGDAWVLVDSSDAPELLGREASPDVLLADLVGDELPDTGDAEVTTAAAEQAATLGRPAVAGLRMGLLGGAALALAAGALALVLGTVAGAPARARDLGVLRLLGMTARRARRLLAWELAPVTVTAMLAGVALGTALTWLISSVVDLRSFVGGTLPVAPVVPVAAVTATALGVAVLVAIIGIIASARGTRTRLADTARMGAE